MCRMFFVKMFCLLGFVLFLLWSHGALALPGVQISPLYGLQTHADVETGFNQIFYRRFHPQFNYPLVRLTASSFDKANPRWVSDPGLQWVDEDGELATCQGGDVFAYVAYVESIKETFYGCVFDRDSRKVVVIADLPEELVLLPEDEIAEQDESEEVVPDDSEDQEGTQSLDESTDAGDLDRSEEPGENDAEASPVKDPVQDATCADCASCSVAVSCPCLANFAAGDVSVVNNVNVSVDVAPATIIPEQKEELPVPTSLSVEPETQTVESPAGSYYIKGSGCSLVRQNDLRCGNRAKKSGLWASFILFILLVYVRIQGPLTNSIFLGLFKFVRVPSASDTVCSSDGSPRVGRSTQSSAQTVPDLPPAQFAHNAADGHF